MVEEDVLHAFVPNAEVREIFPLEKGFIAHHTCAVHLADHPSVVLQKLDPRLLRREGIGAIENMIWAHDVCADMGSAPVTVPFSYACKDGCHHVIMDGAPWRCMSYHENRRPEAVTPDIAFALGRALRALHASFRKVPAPPCPYSPPTVEKLARLLAREDLSPDLADIRTQMTGWAGQADLPDLGNGPCHGDPKVQNWLYLEDKPYVLIDWDMAHIGPLARDLGDLMRSVCWLGPEGDTTPNHAGTAAVAEGYGTDAISLEAAQLCMRWVFVQLALRRLYKVHQGVEYFRDDLLRDAARGQVLFD